MDQSTATIVATPNSASVNPTLRSRTTDWSTARVRPKMLYSPVWASDSGAGGVRDCTPRRRAGVRISISADAASIISYWGDGITVSSEMLDGRWEAGDGERPISHLPAPISSHLDTKTARSVLS